MSPVQLLYPSFPVLYLADCFTSRIIQEQLSVTRSEQSIQTPRAFYMAVRERKCRDRFLTPGLECRQEMDLSVNRAGTQEMALLKWQNSHIAYFAFKLDAAQIAPIFPIPAAGDACVKQEKINDSEILGVKPPSSSTRLTLAGCNRQW